MAVTVQDYQAAVRQLELAKAAVRPLAVTIENAGRNIRRWPKAAVRNAPAGVDYPDASKQDHAFDCKGWPSAEQVGSVLRVCAGC